MKCWLILVRSQARKQTWYPVIIIVPVCPLFQAAHRHKAIEKIDKEGMTHLERGDALTKLKVLGMIHGIIARQSNTADALVAKANELTQAQADKIRGLQASDRK